MMENAWLKTMRASRKTFVWIACRYCFEQAAVKYFDRFQINSRTQLKGSQGQQSFQAPKLIVVMLLSVLKRRGGSLTAGEADL